MSAAPPATDAPAPSLAVNAKDAAAMLGVAPRTLANWRTLGIGPAYVRIGQVHSRTLYRVNDLQAWLEANRVETTASKAVAS